jgi:hypothetical protein
MEIAMTQLITGLLATALAASFAGSVQAAAVITKSEYKAATQRAEASYKVEKKRCDSLAGNAKDVCQAEAKARKMRAEAEAKAAYKNTRSARYDQHVANAEADYLVAKEKCDDQTGNNKNVCVKEAKAARTKAEADAKAQRKSGDAQSEARKETNAARRDAVVEKRDADYKVELERCDSLAGSAKDICVEHAKQKFGKS